MFRIKKHKLRVILLGLLTLTVSGALYYYIKANSIHTTVIPAETTFFTPGQKDNCKWVIHVSVKTPNTV